MGFCMDQQILMMLHQCVVASVVLRSLGFAETSQCFMVDITEGQTSNAQSVTGWSSIHLVEQNFIGNTLDTWKAPWRICNEQEPMSNVFWNLMATWWSLIKSITFQFVLSPSIRRWRNFPIYKSLIPFKISYFRLALFGLWRNCGT